MFNPSAENQLILDFSNHSKNNVIFAGPGCGKTTQGTELIAKYKGINPNGKVLFCAFNKESAKDIQKKIDAKSLVGVKCSTIHALGFGLAVQYLSSIGKKATMVNDNFKITYAFQKFLEEKNVDTTDFPFHKITTCINLMKEYLLFDAYAVNTKAQLGIEAGLEYINDFFEYYQDKIIRSLNNGNYYNGFKLVSGFHYKFDFTDLLFLSYLAKNEGFTPTEKFDLIIVDEYQDVSPLKEQVITMFSHSDTKFFRIGDLNQSINQFAGATTDCFEKAIETSTCFSLTTSYRISKDVVRYINREFPDIDLNAYSGNTNGVVSEFVETSSFIEAAQKANSNKETIALITLKNASLFPYAIELLKNDIPFEIRGNDIKSNVLGIFKQVKGSKEAYETLQKKKVGAIYKTLKNMFPEKPTKDIKRMPEYRVQSEPFQIIEALILHYNITDLTKIEAIAKKIFVGESETKGNVVLLTAHKSKGLEFQDVYIANHPDFLFESDKMNDTDRLMQKNLRFVAYSRTKNGLYFLVEPKQSENNQSDITD